MEHIFRIYPSFGSFCNGIYLWIKDSVFIFPMFLSILSAWIFWAVFSDLPEKRKRASMLPLIQLDMINIRAELFRLFEGALTFEPSQPSSYQSAITAGTLKVEDFKLTLHNKCLNDKYMYDECKGLLVSFGPEMYSRFKSIERLIDKLLGLLPYTSMEQVHLLERIRTTIRVYYHDGMLEQEPSGKVGKDRWFPQNPTLFYRAKNFHELYTHFLELQDLLLKEPKYHSPMLYTIKMIYLLKSGQHQACIDFIHDTWDKTEDSFNRTFTLASCHFYIGERSRFLNYVSQLFKSDLTIHEPVSYRKTFKPFLNDTDFVSLLNARFTAQQLLAMKISIEQDEERDKVLSHRNRYLEQHYLDKLISRTSKTGQ